MRQSHSASHAGAWSYLLLMKSREVMGIHGPAALVRVQHRVANDAPLSDLAPRQAGPQKRHAALTNRR
jgi:hypothetical protein